jgi:hypothetical protein
MFIEGQTIRRLRSFLLSESTKQQSRLKYSRSLMSIRRRLLSQLSSATQLNPYEMRARARTVRAVRAGPSRSWSHFDALQSVSACGVLHCYSTNDVSEDTELRTIPGVTQHHSLPRTTADARHATGQAGAHPCTNPASCVIFKPLFSHL